MNIPFKKSNKKNTFEFGLPQKKCLGLVVLIEYNKKWKIGDIFNLKNENIKTEDNEFYLKDFKNYDFKIRDIEHIIDHFEKEYIATRLTLYKEEI